MSNSKTFCSRHHPDFVKQKKVHSDFLKSELEQLPLRDQTPINNLWSVFDAAPAQQRILILKGLLSTCCTSQLSYLASALQPLLRIDFTVILPIEISIKIFTYLDAQSLCKAAQVNKRWREIADDDILWHRMCEQHIDRKCTKCGWRLALLQKPKLIRSPEKRVREDSTEDLPNKRTDRKLWKDIYSERLVVERHWRKNKYVHRVLKGHMDGVMCLQFCEYQNMLITGSYDKTIIVWNLETGALLETLKGHTRCVRTLQFDDTKLVTGSMDNTLRIWNYRTGQCIRTLEGHTNGVVHLHFDARILASGSADATIKIWNFQTGKCYTLTGHTHLVNHVKIYNNSTSLVSTSDDTTIRIWDLEKRTCTRVLQGHLAPVQVAVPSMPGLIHRFEDYTANLQIQKTHTGTSFQAPSTSSTTSVPVIISGSLDTSIKIWSIETGNCLGTLLGHAHGVWTLAYDKQRLVSGSHDGIIKIWDIEKGNPMYSLQGHTSAVTAIALGDAKVVSASDNGEIHIWDYGAII
ncbi:quinon protein alcohol dehydrogenase-like superfamily [Phycomyces blakesleeanus]|uniref:Quinon protein alcohol dehydrogenase-like superfamily n=1 Tax=Phycomyces blakesleeanus TaxID=4837 RepID=A0ABR3BCK7_PHYBL